MAGDCKMVGDIDRDGLPDLVVAGSRGEDMRWYRYPALQPMRIAQPQTEFSTDGALGDVDGDGDLDVVVPDAKRMDNLQWFENPLPAGDPAAGDWASHAIGSIGGWGKDVELADFDGDGRLDVATREDRAAMIFFQGPGRGWTRTVLAAADIGAEGMTSGDLDRDGHADLVLRGFWRRNPGGAAAREDAAWQDHEIGPVPYEFKAHVADLDGDGRPGVVFASSEGTAEVVWWRSSVPDGTGPWTGTVILPATNRVHTVQSADMDLDGTLDLVLAQLRKSPARRVMVLYNRDGGGTRWEPQVIATTGLHNGVVADIDRDGDFDLFGASYTGYPPVRLWLNQRRTPQGWAEAQQSAAGRARMARAAPGSPPTRSGAR